MRDDDWVDDDISRKMRAAGIGFREAVEALAAERGISKFSKSSAVIIPFVRRSETAGEK